MANEFAIELSWGVQVPIWFTYKYQGIALPTLAVGAFLLKEYPTDGAITPTMIAVGPDGKWIWKEWRINQPAREKLTDEAKLTGALVFNPSPMANGAKYGLGAKLYNYANPTEVYLDGIFWRRDGVNLTYLKSVVTRFDTPGFGA